VCDGTLQADPLAYDRRLVRVTGRYRPTNANPRRGPSSTWDEPPHLNQDAPAMAGRAFPHGRKIGDFPAQGL